MFNHAPRFWPVMVVAVLLTLAACSKKDASPLTDTSGPLRYVPADTPYVLAGLEPAPDDFLDKMEPNIDQLLATYRSMLEVAVATATAEYAEEESDSKTDTREAALVEEFMTLLSLDGLRGAGMTRDSTLMFYGHGLLPVLRISLTDDALLDAAIARIETSAGKSMPVGEIQGKPYRYFDADKIRVILATIDDQMILTVIPSSFEDSQLVPLLGLTLPAENIAQTGVLEEIATQYGYLATYVGFVSTERIFAAFIDEPEGLNKDLLSLMGNGAGMLDDICKEEIRSLAAVMPRMVTGYREISVERVTSSVVVELREDLAAGLATISAAVPGLGKSHDAMFSLGMSMNLMAAREFLEARLDALEAEPYQCDKLSGMQQIVAGGRQALSQPLPPIAYNFRGFLTIVEDIQGFDFQRKAPPESIDASFLLAMEDPSALLAFGQMIPGLAEMNLEPNDAPQQFELPAAQSGIDSAWIALSESALAISVSPDAESVLPEMLHANSVTPPLFMSMDVDAASYYKMLGEAMKQDDDEIGEEMAAAIADLMLAAAGFYDRFAVHVGFTARGIEISAEATLAD